MDTRTATKPSLTLKRHLNAAPAKVFAAWTDPEKVKHWMGPGDVKVLRVECDPRTGGSFRWVMRSPDGQTHDVSGTYREVVPDRKLVFSWAWVTTPERQSLVTVDIKPDGDGSLLTLTHEQFFDEDARDRHQTGWTGALEKMAAMFA
ncbi:MAG TPA: SRPBCC domain-containing protein [Xanthobacteraceae bacterium]|nr:SRPBCC domain-containing protein [Xanthobacteraceae bacterium]